MWKWDFIFSMAKQHEFLSEKKNFFDRSMIFSPVSAPFIEKQKSSNFDKSISFLIRVCKFRSVAGPNEKIMSRKLIVGTVSKIWITIKISKLRYRKVRPMHGSAVAMVIITTSDTPSSCSYCSVAVVRRYSPTATYNSLEEHDANPTEAIFFVMRCSFSTIYIIM